MKELCNPPKKITNKCKIFRVKYSECILHAFGFLFALLCIKLLITQDFFSLTINSFNCDENRKFHKRTIMQIQLEPLVIFIIIIFYLKVNVLKHFKLKGAVIQEKLNFIKQSQLF